MNNKVIEVLDYMGEKLGIAVDWTAENVWPSVMDFLSRYQVYAIVVNCVWLLFGAILLVACVCLFKTMIKQYKESDGIFYRDDEALFLGIVIGVIASLASIVLIMCDIFAIAQWITVPEMKFIEVFSEYIK